MRYALVMAAAFCCLFLALSANAHEVRPAQLNINEISDTRYFVKWRVPARQGQKVGIDVEFSGQCAYRRDEGMIYSGGAATQTFVLQCPSGVAGEEIYISNLAATMLDVMINIDFLDGQKIHTLIRPSSPSYIVPQAQEYTGVARDYLMLGIAHILLGWDHLAFVLGLVLLLRQWRPVLIAVSGFTVAHSVTLCLVALGYMQVSVPAVEAVIALSIIVLAVEILKNKDKQRQTLIISRPWLVSSVFGLFHGLGFASALANYGLPSHAQVFALVAFNIGVEVGQIVFIALLLALSVLAQNFPTYVVRTAHYGSVWLLGVMGSYWFIGRFSGVLKMGLFG